MRKILIIGAAVLLSMDCKKEGCTDSAATNYDSKAKKNDGSCTYAVVSADGYTGTGNISQGLATTTTANLVSCGGRVAGLGVSTDSKGNVWTVPASVNFTSSSFPTASDLYNDCNGNKHANSSTAIAALSSANVVEVDADGEVITAFVFADNYFEMYINGVPVGKDPIPFTPFNSNIVQFKVKKPFTIAMKLVDWEENLGLGSEDNRGSAYHPGDGGMVAVFKDASNQVIAITDNTWKAQTFYTAPMYDLTCLSESGTTRSSSSCSTTGTNSGSNYYAVHWQVPSTWYMSGYDDSSWPAATTFTNETIGVDNKSSYTNFTDIFDNSSNDAKFIWSTNVVLDNEVIVRKTVN